MRRSVYGRSRAEVSSKLGELTRARAAGLPVLSDKLTVERYLADWLEAAAPKLRPPTLASYASHVSDTWSTPTLTSCRPCNTRQRTGMQDLLAGSETA